MEDNIITARLRTDEILYWPVDIIILILPVAPLLTSSWIRMDFFRLFLLCVICLLLSVDFELSLWHWPCSFHLYLALPLYPSYNWHVAYLFYSTQPCVALEFQCICAMCVTVPHVHRVLVLISHIWSHIHLLSWVQLTYSYLNGNSKITLRFLCVPSRYNDMVYIVE